MPGFSSNLDEASVHQLTLAFRDATRTQLAFVSGSVQQGCVQELADEGIAILNHVEYREVDAALSSARNFVKRFNNYTYSGFLRGLPTLIEAGRRAEQSSKAALQTLAQGQAHLTDHLQNIDKNHSDLTKQRQDLKERAQSDRGSSNAWWWAAALTTPLVFGAFFWIPTQHYKGLAERHEAQASLMQQKQQALQDELHPTFAKLATLLLLAAETFGEVHQHLQDICEAAEDAKTGQEANCKAYFSQVKAAMLELQVSIDKFDEQMKKISAQGHTRLS